MGSPITLHVWEIDFGSHGPGWTPAVITHWGDVLAESPDVFSSSASDFDSCSLLPSKVSVPPNSSPVTSCLYRTTLHIAEQVDAVLDNFCSGLASSTTSTSSWASLVVVIPKLFGGIRITGNYKKLSKLSVLGQFPIPRDDEILDMLGTVKVLCPRPRFFVPSIYGT